MDLSFEDLKRAIAESGRTADVCVALINSCLAMGINISGRSGGHRM